MKPESWTEIEAGELIVDSELGNTRILVLENRLSGLVILGSCGIGLMPWNFAQMGIDYGDFSFPNRMIPQLIFSKEPK